MKSLFLLFAGYLFLKPIYAQQSGRQNSNKLANQINAVSLIEQVEAGVIIIRTLQQGVRTGIGTGFFVSKEGLVITNRHVVESVLSGNDSIQFETKDGKVFGESSIKIVYCDDASPVDLCLFKLDFKPAFSFEVKPIKTPKGLEVFAIGHPRGYEFTLSKGIITGERDQEFSRLSPTGTQEVMRVNYIQTLTPISPGNSGGPIFDAVGNLIGVATWIRTDKGSQNLNFGISAREVFEFLNKRKVGYLTFADLRSIQRTTTTSNSKKLKEKLFLPIFERLDQGRSFDGLIVKMVPFDLQLDKVLLKVRVPDIFGPNPRIKKLGDGKLSTGYSIYSPSQNVSFYVNFEFLAPSKVKTLDGKLFSNPEALPIVKELMESNQWEKVKAGLSEKQLKYLYSVPGRWDCKVQKKSPRYFWNNSTVCMANIFNDSGPGVSTYVYTAQVEGAPWAITSAISIPNAYTSWFFYDLPVLAVGASEIVR
jgi:S1-C subfamily serine protease